MFNPDTLAPGGMLVKMSEVVEKESNEGRRNFSLRGDVSETDKLC